MTPTDIYEVIISLNIMNYVTKFRKDCSISDKADLRSIAIAVEAIYKSNDIVDSIVPERKYENCDIDKDVFLYYTYLNIFKRIFEHAKGVLVCIASSSYSSSEALARVVVEGAVNLIYMLDKGNESTVIAFYDSWLDEHERKLSDLVELFEQKKYPEHAIKKVSFRHDYILGLKQAFDIIINNTKIVRSADKSKVWPKSLFKRFEEIGLDTDYYESYHRLSGSSHITGEDTLSYIFSLILDNEKKREMRSESIHYSIMMTRVASIFFVDAASRLCRFYGMEDLHEFESIDLKLAHSVLEIAKHAGVPQVE